MNNAIAKTTVWTLQPSSFNEVMDYAKLIANSDLAPKDYRGKPGNIIVAIQMGGDVGLSPMQSLANIAVINGRATLWGDALLAVVQASPECEDVVETLSNGVATCVVKRRGHEPTIRTFSMDDAKRAGLAGKQGPWSQYPNRMLQMRARGFALRDAFADVLKGLQSAEEVSDYDSKPIAKAEVVDKAPAKALVVENKPASVPPPSAAEAPKSIAKFQWKASTEWHGRPLTDAPSDVVVEYSDMLAAVMLEKKGGKAAAIAAERLQEAEDELAVRMQREADKAPEKPSITDALDAKYRETRLIDENDQNGEWGMTDSEEGDR